MWKFSALAWLVIKVKANTATVPTLMTPSYPYVWSIPWFFLTGLTLARYYHHFLRFCFSFPNIIRGDHLSGKPRNVREFETCQGNVREKMLSGKSVPKLFITSWIFAFNSIFTCESIVVLAMVILSWCLSQPGTDRSPGEIETSGFYHMIA